MVDIDIRDIAIINALPNITYGELSILTIGCGGGRLESYLQETGYQVLGTDLNDNREYKNFDFVEFDIFKPLKIKRPVVICSEVLEHIPNFTVACYNILELATDRIIITVPYKTSFLDPTHCNFWDDTASYEDGIGYRGIGEFYSLFAPYSLSISKIRTKEEDRDAGRFLYLIVVDLNHY